MKNLILGAFIATYILSSTNILYAQSTFSISTNKRSAIRINRLNSVIEINPYIRWDWYPEFSYVMESGSPNSWYTKIIGTSLGVDANIKFPLNNRGYYTSIGLGYYRYSFNKMKNHSTLFKKNSSRVIAYPSTLYMLYWTNKYWYNTISINIGIGKLFTLNDNTTIKAGITLNNYGTFSQYYRITANYPAGPHNHKYTTKNQRYFGLSTNIKAELLKRVYNFTVGPTIMVPIFDLWKQDRIFQNEKNSGTRNKWLRGLGVGISINYLLSKK